MIFGNLFWQFRDVEVRYPRTINGPSRNRSEKSRTFPSTIIRSDWIIVFNRWAMVKTVQCSNSVFIVFWITSSVVGSTFAVASSTNRIELFFKIALPRHRSCFWPTLNKLKFWFHLSKMIWLYFNRELTSNWRPVRPVGNQASQIFQQWNSSVVLFVRQTINFHRNIFLLDLNSFEPFLRRWLVLEEWSKLNFGVVKVEYHQYFFHRILLSLACLQISNPAKSNHDFREIIWGQIWPTCPRSIMQLGFKFEGSSWVSIFHSK